MGADSKARRENLRRRILVPLGAGLALLLATCVISIRQVAQRQIHSAVEAGLEGVRELLQMELDGEAKLQSSLLKSFQTDETLRTYWLNRDRAALLNHVQPIFERIRSDHGINHFHFIDTNRVCFLRIHNPDQFGDTIPRITLATAVQNHTGAHGIELGRFGTLTFRSVLPWHLDGRLIGYIELGQEVSHVEDELSNIINVDIAITVYKSYLDSACWVEGNRILERVGNWDQYDDFVAAGKAAENTKFDLRKWQVASHNQYHHITIEMEQAGRPHLARSLALIDAGGREIGDMLILKDISAEMSALRTLTSITVVAGIIVGAMLFVMFYIILGRIEAKLERTRKNWMAEIDERKRVMEELADHNGFMQNVFASLTYPFYVIDAKSHQVLMGNAATGLTTNASTITCHELMHGSSKPCGGAERTCPLTEARRTKKPVTVEHIRYDKKGNPRRIEVHGYPILDCSGEVIQLIEYTLDITDRVRQERELRKLSAAVDQSANLICISNPDGIIEYVNPEFCRVTGYSSSEAVGQRTNLLKSGYHDDAFYSELWQDISSGKTWSGRTRNRRKDGELFWARLRITPIFNAAKEIINYLAVTEDITNEIIAQQRLAESDKLSAIGTLAAGVAHEFKNYLAGIIGNASFALSTLKDEDGMKTAQDSFEQIVELGERANSVAMSLLTYSKATLDEIAPEYLRGIIENTIRIVDKEIRNQSIEILTHFEDLPPVMVSASKIQQVILNLIINTQHAIDSGGVITIGLMRQDDLAIIKVSDTGKGIPSAHLSSIFDPFFSTKGVWGKDAVAGTGMGLSISRNIAREHRGDLTVESVVGVGTTFSFHLPLDSTDLPTASKGHTCSCHRLMLHTVDQSLAGNYQRQTCDSGCQLRVVEDIDEVLKDLNTIIDIVICDGNLPSREKLFRMFEVYRKYDVRCAVVNIGTSGCRDAISADAAVVSFEETPPLPEIIQSVQEVEVDKSSA